MGLLDKRHGGGLRPPPNPKKYIKHIIEPKRWLQGLYGVGSVGAAGFLR